MDAIPQGGGYRFDPRPSGSDSDENPRDRHYDGVSRDVWVGGERVARSAADGATYCCGVTFEVFAHAWARWCEQQGVPARLGELVGEPLHDFVTTWFCPTTGHLGVVEALVSSGLGFRVKAAEARSGDFCQFWRSTDPSRASGHSVVFLGWEDSERTWLRYWSSQAVTGGVGVHRECVGEGWTIGFARAGTV